MGTIQQDPIIIEHIRKVRSNRIDLEKRQEVIRKQSKEISSKIDSHRYHARHRCCPSLLKEIWHSF